MVDDFGVVLSEDDSEEDNQNHIHRSPPEIQVGLDLILVKC